MRTALLVLIVAACGSEKTPALPTKGSSAPVVHDAAIANIIDASVPIDAAPAPTRPERVVYDLVDNRHSAHRTVNGGLVLDGADIGFSRYTLIEKSPQWKLGQVVDGVRTAVPQKVAVLQVPLTVEQARTTDQLTMLVHAAADVTMSLAVNGVRASKNARVTLTAGTSIVAINVDAKNLVVGENELTLDWKRKGTAKKDEVTVAIEWVRIGPKQAVALSVPRGQPSTLALTPDDPRSAAVFEPRGHTIYLKKEATLTYFVLLPDGANLVADVQAPCTVDVRARPSADAFAGGVLDSQRNRVDLTQMAGRAVALTLTAHDCDRATISRPRITLHGEEPARLRYAPPPKYIVLWEMDGVRADSLPAFMPRGRASTPTIDELAKTSTVFRQVYSRGQQSLMPGDKVPDFARIAAGMQKDGYTAAAVTGAGTSLVDEAIRQMDAMRAKPAYLVVSADHTLVCPTPPVNLANFRELYDAGLTAIDEDLGRFIKQLRTWGIWDQTMLVVVANHGEELYETGRCGFGQSVHDAVVHVPLLIHDPSRFPAGVVDEGADAAALFSAIWESPMHYEASLMLLAQGVGRGWARPSFAITDTLRAVRIGRWKFTADLELSHAWMNDVGDGAVEGSALNLATVPVELRMLVDNLSLYLAARDLFDDLDAGPLTQMTPRGAQYLDTASFSN